MASDKRTGETMYTVWGRFEAATTRNMLMSWSVVGICILLIVGLLFYVVELEQKNTHLANNRIMYAFPDQDGVLVSSRSRPESMVKRFARDFLFNLYNYDAETVRDNFERVAEMVAPNKAVSLARKLKNDAESVERDRLTQMLTIISEKPLAERDERYVYTVRARVTSYIASTEAEQYTSEITVVLRKVPPTTSRKEGLWVSSVKERRI